MAIETQRALVGAGLAAVLLLLLGGCQLIGRVIGTAARVAVPVATAKFMYSCIPEGTPVDTPAGPVAIQALLVGDPIVGFDGETVRILQIHAYAEDPEGEFRGIEFADGSRVDLCGMHRIDGVRACDLHPGDPIAGRVVSAIAAYRGVERSYDLLTEDAGYRIDGLPVNSMIEEMVEATR